MLYKLGVGAFKHRWWVVGAWVAIAIMAGVAMSIWQKPVTESFSIPGTESAEALERLEEVLPAASGSSGRIVFAAPEGDTIAAYQEVIDEALAKVGKVDDVAAIYSPFMTGAVSPDGRIALAQVQLGVSADEIEPSAAEDVAAALAGAREAGLQAEVGGDIIARAPEGILGIGEIGGVVVAAIVLIITFGTFVAAGMPLLIAIAAIGISSATLYALTPIIDINETTPVLAIMLGLAVGIDYALFIIMRARKYLTEGMTPRASAGRAIATAGNAVIFAALTVVIALSALAIVGVPFIASMGLAAAATVALAACVAVTLVPALLGFAGHFALSRGQRKAVDAGEKPRTQTLGRWWARTVTRWPLVPILVVVLGLGALALPFRDLALGFPSQGNEPTTSTERKAYDLTSEGFGPGFNGPLIVMADLPASSSEQALQMQIGQIAGNLMRTEGVASAQPAGISEDGRVAIFQVVSSAAPLDDKTKDLIRHIREHEHDIAGQNVDLAITGSTALSIDIDDKLANVLPRYLAIVVGLSLILLLIVFHSVIVPIKAALGFILTIGATFGIVTGFYQYEWFGLFDASPMMSFLPILLTGILFGLAMDYEFFLLSSMHEAYEHDGDNARDAVVNGFSQGARVVSAAAIIMISVFAGFIFNHNDIIQMMGFALAIGIFIDAFIVRMTLVPAVMALFGRAAWWTPKWLDKFLPKVAIDADDAPVAKSTAKK